MVFENAFNGVEQMLDMEINNDCNYCDGLGTPLGCPACRKQWEVVRRANWEATAFD